MGVVTKRGALSRVGEMWGVGFPERVEGWGVGESL